MNHNGTIGKIGSFIPGPKNLRGFYICKKEHYGKLLLWGIYGQIAHLTYHTIVHNAPKMKRSDSPKKKFCNFYTMCLGHQWFCKIAPFFKCEK